MERIIQSKRSVIVAADVESLDDLQNLSEAVSGVPGISGTKLGFALAWQDLSAAVDIAKHYVDGPVIYDHQKGGNDIPKIGAVFARGLKAAGVDAAILFPFAGPATQEAWTKACFDTGLQVFTGGIMTHPQFLVSEGGYVADEAVKRIYFSACDWGVRHFVVPGTKLDWVKRIRSWLVEKLGEGNFVPYAPGFITQGGDISECGQEAGDEWHAIVGEAIYGKLTRELQRQAAIAVTSQIAAARV